MFRPYPEQRPEAVHLVDGRKDALPCLPISGQPSPDVDVPRIAVTLPYSPGNMQAAACTLFPIHVSEDTGLTCLSDARQTSVVPPLIADLRGNGNQASLPHCVHLRPVILTSFP